MEKMAKLVNKKPNTQLSLIIAIINNGNLCVKLNFMSKRWETENNLMDILHLTIILKRIAVSKNKFSSFKICG